ncbi:immunoglobulin-like variable motif protein, putative [Ichthyophthirius multifiliis]|uniref:Immunoglobulin-like variable motif protein, putative n=1 Tax=Ichthyophthirius multifiliis TaxID=5932 RepID=G0QYV6_ICHMU|nr:immunoglobulin-like variable motif protein, putative [Ichthyophthirius multifiliis]EGR29601.1 immunoglobulin-like variable motif protein, putative [Ichthyophthirius multifiliis]|eukprot:XP_004030837.1 immunoglobulin-like variable motif protein, putative [Ichthyophthirius multifiliis]
MQQRKFLDQKRWFCLSRPQYQRSCGISSLMSCWNYLYSTLGVGNLPPISVEEALQILGIEQEGKLFADTEFGSFTGNGTLIRWFKLICKHFQVDGTAFIFWKLCGDNATNGVDEKEALSRLEEGLRNENMTFIYHAHDHYFCPVGYEICPQRPVDAYNKLDEINQNELDHWIFIGEPSKRYPAFHIKLWSEIVKDISTGNPYYYNIRHPEKGIMERKGEIYKTKKAGTSINCIMAFQKFIKKSKKVKITQEAKNIQEIQNEQTTLE